MIPPSLTLIVYGVTVDESISKLFMAGILPGLVLAAMFMAYAGATRPSVAQLQSQGRPADEPAARSSGTRASWCR